MGRIRRHRCQALDGQDCSGGPARNECRRGRVAGSPISALEMPEALLSPRLIASKLWQPRRQETTYQALLTGKCPISRRGMHAEAAEEMKAWPLLIEDEPGLTAAEIEARARVIASKLRAKARISTLSLSITSTNAGIRRTVQSLGTNGNFGSAGRSCEAAELPGDCAGAAQPSCRGQRGQAAELGGCPRVRAPSSRTPTSSHSSIAKPITWNGSASAGISTRGRPDRRAHALQEPHGTDHRQAAVRTDQHRQSLGQHGLRTRSAIQSRCHYDHSSQGQPALYDHPK